MMWQFAGDHPVWFLVYVAVFILFTSVGLIAIVQSVLRIFEAKYSTLAKIAEENRKVVTRNQNNG